MRQPIPAQWDVPAKFRARMGEGAGKQRAMVEAGHLLLVLHAVPAEGDSAREARLFWRSPDGTWRSAGQGGGVGALKEHLAEFELHVDELEERASAAASAQRWFSILRLATPLQRTVHHLAHALQAAREAIDDRELINLRDRALELERTLDLVTVEARDALNFVAAQKAEAQAASSLELARESHRLNVVTAVFLPITALASVFSMTMRSGLEAWAAPWTFWIVVVAGVLLGLFMRGQLKSPSLVKDEPSAHAESIAPTTLSPEVSRASRERPSLRNQPDPVPRPP